LYQIWYKEGVLDLKKAIIAIGSVTNAIRSRKLLSKSNIRSKLVKLDASKTITGCTYGLEVSERDLYSIFSLLRNEEIAYSLYNE
jgi:hypothetical protein